ncbi:hypothetical protein GCM10009854_31680 [Saccharopolyspora halophila]|uniref:Uncharacterized protein n=1 Tax=Saccharopolyspora halophila TaxID=405551 RepID=A0ABN3GHH9_9PSEU
MSAGIGGSVNSSKATTPAAYAVLRAERWKSTVDGCAALREHVGTGAVAGVSAANIGGEVCT